MCILLFALCNRYYSAPPYIMAACAGSVTLLYAGGQLLGQLHLDPHEQLAPPPRPALDNFTIQISITLWTTKSLVTLSLNPVLACQDGE